MMYEVAQPSNTKALISIEDYLAVIGRRKWVVIGAALAGLLLAYLFVDSRTDSYEATSTVLVNPTPVGSTNNNLISPKLDREVLVIASDGISSDAAALITDRNVTGQQLKENLSLSFTAGSDVIEITYSSSDNEFAAEAANAYAEAYVAARVLEQTQFYERQIGGVQDELDLLVTSRDDLSEQLGTLNSRRTDLPNNSSLTQEERSAELDNINTERSVVQNELNGVNNRIRTVETDLKSLTSTFESQAEAGRVLSTAGVPSTPLGLGSLPILAAGLVLGLVFGISAASLIDRLDRSASSPDDVSEALDTTVVGTVPQFLGWRSRRGIQAIVMRSDSRTVRAHEARESFRRLRTAVEYLMRVDSVRTILITSSKPGEGKSVTSGNLAVALASSGVRVALVNGDMRRPTLEILFGHENDVNGLAGYLGKISDEYDPILFDDVPGLALIPAGPAPSNPGELLASARFEELLAELAEQVDLVIVDTPPVGATADAAAASSTVDGVLVLVDAKGTTTEELRSTRADLERAGATVLGAVLNRYSTAESSLFGRNTSYYSAKS